MIDPIGELRRIMSKDNNETFDRATDSLEAISEALGIGPSVGLWMLGRCDAAMAASTTIIVTDNLGTQLPNDVFNEEFWMQVIHNTNNPGVAPEREIRRITDFVGLTQTFTVDAFTANVEAGDLIAIFHESVLPVEILGYGTLTASSATVPADNTRAEVNNYFRGCLLMTTEGAVRFQPRRIVEYTAAGGIFTLDPSNPFTGVPGLVDYVIIGGQAEFIPGADAVINRTPADVIGGKADTADYTPGATTSSIVRFLKGILGSLVIAEGTFDTSSATVPADSTRGEANNWFRGCILIPVAGAVAFQPRLIQEYTAAGGIFTLDLGAPFTAATGLVAYVVIDFQTQVIPPVDSTVNIFAGHVVGGKADTATPTADNVSSAVRYLKGLLSILGNPTGRTNNPDIYQLIGLPDIADLDLYQHGIKTRLHDNFFGGLAGTTIGPDWGAAVIVGSTAVAILTNELRISNPGTGVLGESYLPSVSRYGKHLTIRWKVRVVDGEAAGDGERCKHYVRLYQDANNYFAFGFYRDTSEAINSRGYAWYNEAGAGETALDWDTVNIDNIQREYRIDISPNNIMCYINDVLVGSYEASFLTEFEIQVMGGTEVNTDVIDIRIDEIDVRPFDIALYTNLLRMLAVQGGDANSLGNVQNTLDQLLDFAENPDSGTLTADGTEQTIYDEADTVPWMFEGGKVDLTNMQAGDTVVLRKYARIIAGGGLILEDTNTYNGAQAVPLVTFERQANIYGVRVTLEQTAGVNRTYVHQWFDQMR